LKSPKFDLGKLLENHGGAEAVSAMVSEAGKKLEREDEGASKKAKKGAKKKAAKAAEEDEE